MISGEERGASTCTWLWLRNNRGNNESIVIRQTRPPLSIVTWRPSGGDRIGRRDLRSALHAAPKMTISRPATVMKAFGRGVDPASSSRGWRKRRRYAASRGSSSSYPLPSARRSATPATATTGTHRWDATTVAMAIAVTVSESSCLSIKYVNKKNICRNYITIYTQHVSQTYLFYQIYVFIIYIYWKNWILGTKRLL